MDLKEWQRDRENRGKIILIINHGNKRGWSGGLGVWNGQDTVPCS